MAQSQRTKNKSGAARTDEEAQTRRDRITMIVFLVSAVVVVAAMWLLATFLSGG